jgi:hypothetical protein
MRGKSEIVNKQRDKAIKYYKRDTRRKKTHDKVVLGVVGLAPGRHDEGVVGSNHNHLLNTLGLEGLDVLDEAGQVVSLACGCESARNSDENDLLVLEV